MTRLHKIGVYVLALAIAPAAWADDDKDPKQASQPSYTLTLSTDDPYTFPDGGGLPQITTADVEHSLALGAELGIVSGSLAYIRTATGEGGQVDIGVKTGCVLPENLKCSAGVSFSEVDDTSKATYKLGLEYGSSFFNFEQKWSVGAAYKTTDNTSDSIALAQLAMSKDFEFYLPMTLHVDVGAAYNFEERETEPTWGVRLDLKFSKNWKLSGGYVSRVENFGQDTLEVKRSLVGSLEYSF